MLRNCEVCVKKRENKEFPKKAQHCKIENDLIEPVYGRYCNVQTNVHARKHRLKRNSTFKMNWYNLEF
jgi:hypothetical protein